MHHTNRQVNMQRCCAGFHSQSLHHPPHHTQTHTHTHCLYYSIHGGAQQTSRRTTSRHTHTGRALSSCPSLTYTGPSRSRLRRTATARCCAVPCCSVMRAPATYPYMQHMSTCARQPASPSRRTAHACAESLRSARAEQSRRVKRRTDETDFAHQLRHAPQHRQWPPPASRPTSSVSVSCAASRRDYDLTVRVRVRV